jgi:hypothetical protein
MVHCRWLWGVNIFMLKISDRPNENKWTWFSWISFHHCFHDFHTGVTISWNEVIESQMPSPVPLYIDKRISMQLPWNLQKHSLSTVWKSFWTVWNKMMFLLKTAVGQNWVPQYLYHYIYIIYIYMIILNIYISICGPASKFDPALWRRPETEMVTSLCENSNGRGSKRHARARNERTKGRSKRGWCFPQKRHEVGWYIEMV